MSIFRSERKAVAKVRGSSTGRAVQAVATLSSSGSLVVIGSARRWFSEVEVEQQQQQQMAR